MSSISTPDAASESVASNAASDIVTHDVATVNSWLDQLKLIGIELRDIDGQSVVVTEDNVDEVAAAVKTITTSQAGTSTDSDDTTGDDAVGYEDSEENLPPFELPAAYRETTGRESLSETKAFADHLNEHWGF